MNKPANHREIASNRIKLLLQEIFSSGLTMYKVALMCDRRFNTVANWVKTGVVEYGDALMLESIHRAYCAGRCAVSEQAATAETLLNSRVIFGSMWETVSKKPGFEPSNFAKVGDDGIQRTDLGVGSGKQAISLDPSSTQYYETPKAAAFYIAK